MNRSIAIDGPCGAGKSTIAKQVALKLGGHYLDTGAMYRATGLYMIRNNIALDDTAAIADSMKNVDITVGYNPDGSQITLLNGEDVSALIRTPEVSAASSAVGTVRDVRTALVAKQKQLASEMFLVCDGRDIGTCVITDAALKIFLTADAEERAMRRFKEMKDQSCGFEAVLRDINARDYNDTHRAESPLRKADDAIELDSTHMTIEEVVNEISKLYSERI